MMIKKFAPIAIHTLNRHEHFIRCVESLSRCKYADQTELHIGLDYPSKESHWEGYNKILDYIPNINGFKNVILHKRKTNFGAVNNSRQLKYDILKDNDFFFSTEDDNDFSPNTIEYINICLEKYKNDDSIFAICASHHEIEIPKTHSGTVFKLDSYSPLGVGYWKDKYLQYLNMDRYAYAKAFLKKYSNYLQFKKERLYLIASLLESISTKEILGDGFLTTYLIKNNMKCIFPTIQKVRNHGHDGSGIHCADIKEDNPYKNRIIDTNSDFEFIEEKDTEVLKEIKHNLIRSFRMPFFKRLFFKLRYHLYYVFNISFSSNFPRKFYNKYLTKFKVI